MADFKIYEKDNKMFIERLSAPRFIGEITFKQGSNIENIEWIDSCLDVSGIAKAIREAREFIAKLKGDNKANREQIADMITIARTIMGARMKAIREEKKITYADMQRGSILSPNQIASIESGSANYTIDSWLQYLAAADLEMPFDLRTHKYFEYLMQGYSTGEAVVLAHKEAGSK